MDELPFHEYIEPVDPSIHVITIGKDVKKKVSHGKVAVLISRDYPRGWYTTYPYEQLLYSPDIVDYVLDKSNEKKLVVEFEKDTDRRSRRIRRRQFEHMPDELGVEYITQGKEFEIKVCDGMEIIRLKEWCKFLTA